eukprot:7737582-Lingulodinium_polyedra.AAC.1
MEKDMDFQEELMQVDECMELLERSDQKSMEKAKQDCKDIEVERQLFTEAYRLARARRARSIRS